MRKQKRLDPTELNDPAVVLMCQIYCNLGILVSGYLRGELSFLSIRYTDFSISLDGFVIVYLFFCFLLSC